VFRNPSLEYPERFLRVALEIHRIGVLFVGSGVCRCGSRFRVSSATRRIQHQVTNTRSSKQDIYSTDLQCHSLEPLRVPLIGIMTHLQFQLTYSFLSFSHRCDAYRPAEIPFYFTVTHTTGMPYLNTASKLSE